MLERMPYAVNNAQLVVNGETGDAGNSDCVCGHPMHHMVNPQSDTPMASA